MVIAIFRADYLEPAGDEIRVAVFYYETGNYKECMSANLVFSDDSGVMAEDFTAGEGEAVDPLELYDEFSLRGINYGDSYRVVASVEVIGDAVRASLVLPELRNAANGTSPRVANLDAGFQSILPSFMVKERENRSLYLPYFIQNLIILGDLSNAVDIHVQECSDAANSGKTSIGWLDGAGNLLARMSGVRIKHRKLSKANVGNEANWVSDFVRGVFSEHLRIPLARLTEDKHFDELGIDSVMMTQLIGKLEHRFGELPKTLLFEFQTLGALSNHLEGLGAKVAPVTQHKDDDPVLIYETLPTKYSALLNDGSRQFKRNSSPVELKSARDGVSQSDDIVIVGLSGRFPKAANIKEFWRNIRDGVDCITEISAARFGKEMENSGQAPGNSYQWGGFIVL